MRYWWGSQNQTFQAEVRGTSCGRRSRTQTGPVRTRSSGVMMRDIRRLWLAVLIASVILVSTVVLFRSLKSTPFHKDESGWIASGNYYSDLLLKHDFAWENWQCSACGP